MTALGRKVENILVRMPDSLEYFLPATAVFQDYVTQLQRQVIARTRSPNVRYTVEFADDSFIAFAPVFDGMEIIMWELDRKFTRDDWQCVLDFRDIARARNLVRYATKHVAEAWGIMFGAGSIKVPNLGVLAQMQVPSTADILLDAALASGPMLTKFMETNHPGIVIAIADLDRRPGVLLRELAKTKMVIAKRSGASYLAVSMGKPLLEVYPRDEPPYWLSKPNSPLYRVFYDREMPEMIWPFMEDMWAFVNGLETDDSVDTVMAG